MWLMFRSSFCLPAVVAVCLVLFIGSGQVRGAEPQPLIAPLNTDFADFMATNGAPAKLLSSPGEEEHPFGFVPGPVDYSYLQGQQIGSEQTEAFAPARYSLPLQYDLRTQGKLTPIRDQGSCGACWAFAAMGSVESVLEPIEERDFSENNLKNKHGFDWGHCDGGNGDMSTAYFAKGAGPVNESDDPYNVSSNVSPGGLSTQKLLTKAVILPPRVDFLDNDAIKQAIMDYGAVQSSYYSSSSTSYYRSATASYYYNGASNANHAITLVGWDDNYDKSNFAIVPPGNGAFIVRNSWGTFWGQSGYFYMSYYDVRIGSDNYQFRGLEPVSKYANLYQYDPLGVTSNLGYGAGVPAWFANIFTATGTESITGAGFHVASANSPYEWYVYTGVTPGSPRSGALAASGSGTLAAPGYQVVSLTPVPVTPGQTFSVVIKLTTPGYAYPIPMERPWANYSSLATAAAGQSYYCSNGLSWIDLTSSYANTNVALKALSQYEVTASVSGGNGTVSSPNPAYTGIGGTVTFTLVPDAGYQPVPEVTGSCPTGSFTGNDYTTGTISGSCTVMFSFAPEGARRLTLSVSGAGGSITSTPAPPGGSCTTSCNQYFANGEVVTLTPTPASGSVFSGWSGDCSGSGSCQVTMDSAKSVTAIFEWEQNVKNSANGSTHGLIGPVYNLLSGGETVMVRERDFSEDLSFNRSISFTLKGGYDASFLVASSYSTIHGSIAVVDGSVILENIVLAP